MVFSGRAATGGGAPSRSPSSVAAVAAGDDDLHAFYKQYIQFQSYSSITVYIRTINYHLSSSSSKAGL